MLPQSRESNKAVFTKGTRYKRVIGDTLRSREDGRCMCEIKIGVKTLNRMLELGRPVCVRAD